MQALYPRLKAADILVLATPVYVPLPGEMQNFMNRLVPLIDPYLIRRGPRTRARPNKDVRIKRIALVSTCGWWELGNFGTVVRIAREISKDLGVEFAGAVLRPHAQRVARGGEKADAVLRAARRAGEELVRTGRFSRSVLDAVAQPLISEQEFRRRSHEQHDKLRASL
jgi:multimeric flavodoxin WrbA